jgi:hypothetical protein
MSDTPVGDGWWQASDGKWYPPNMTPGSLPPPPPPVVEEASRPPWWRRRWVLITAGVVVVLMVIGALSSPDEDDEDGEVATETTSADTTSDEPTPEPTEEPAEEPTQTPEPEPTATAEPTSTPEPTPAPTLTRREEREVAQIAFGIVFDDRRGDLLDLLRDDTGNIESVDRFEFDQDAGAVVLDITSPYQTAEFQVESAWTLTTAFAQLYRPDDEIWFQEAWVPDFVLINSGTRYECPGDFMVRLGDARASRSEWEREC